MDLCEAIEAFKARKISWRELDPDIITIILNAVEVGTLIPADQCFEVREGYKITGLQTPAGHWQGFVDKKWLSEALQIRSADDVRREVLGGWESIEAAKRVAYRAGYYQAECQLEEPDHIASSVDKWKEEVRRVTLEEAANAIEWKYNDATRDGILMWAHDEIRDLIDTPAPSTDDGIPRTGEEQDDLLWRQGRGDPSAFEMPPSTDTHLDECPLCGLNWGEHRRGYAAHKCPGKPNTPSTDATPTVVEAAQKVVDEYEDQTHGPVIYSIDELRDALAEQKGDE